MRTIQPTVIITFWFLLGPAVLASATPALSNTYVVVDSGVTGCFDNRQEIDCRKAMKEFDGQDGHYVGNQPAYKDNNDGTVTDLHTGLTWQKTPSLNKVTYGQAQKTSSTFSLAGYSDWRLPTIKELYSLIDFRGNTMPNRQQATPYIDTNYFDFYYGDTSRGERLIDAQYWSSTEYTATTINAKKTVFGVNFADGRIKGYPAKGRGLHSGRFVRYVRGNPDYGKNLFVDNNNGTITDEATGLMWQKDDSRIGMTWQQALNYAEKATIAGYSDWRLPNAKELQSIVDYSRSPASTVPSQRGAAIDPVFTLSEVESWFWSSTTHQEHDRAGTAAYICFGRAWGYFQQFGQERSKIDVHGAGAQRSDPKAGNPDRWPQGRGPQGDEIRINNYVRLVRGGGVQKISAATLEAETSSVVTLSPYQQPPQPDVQGEIQAGTSPSAHQRLHPGFDHPPFQNHGYGLGPQSEESHFLRQFDRNRDGQVSRQEFDGPPKHFTQFDKDQNGFISSAEAPKGPPPGGGGKRIDSVR